MVIADCLVKNKVERFQLFQKIFFLASIGLKIVLKMLFFNFSRADIRFVEREFVWRTYTVAEALPMTRRLEIIIKKKFVSGALNIDNEIFIVHIAALAEPTTIPIHPSYQALVALLTSEENEISAEYSKFSDVFCLSSAVEILEYIGIKITLSIC